MNGVEFGALIIRMLVSLAVVLGLILVAYVIVKRRRDGSPMGSTSSTKTTTMMRLLLGRGTGKSSGKSSGAPRRTVRPGASKRGLQTLGRIGLSRTSNVLAVQFAERVYLLGTSESDAPTVLADVSMDAWLTALEPPPDPSGAAFDANSVVGIPLESAGRPKLLDALREVTTRRG